MPPSTTLILYNNIPFDKNYNNIRLLGSRTTQLSYFSGKAHLTMNSLSYQRLTENVVRVGYTMGQLVNCNYLSFQNVGYENRVIYAFIDNIEYVNDNTSDIYYTIDIFQTYFLDCTLHKCFIERETVASDKVGEHILDEGLNTGEYLLADISTTNRLGTKVIVLACTFDDTFTDIAGALYGGVYSGTMYHAFSISNQGITDLETFIHDATLAGKADGIISAFLFPASFVQSIGTYSPVDYTISKIKKQAGSFSDGNETYTPLNKKLYVYPYNFLYCSSFQGQASAFPYEFFSTSICNFTLTCDFSATATPLLIPNNYKGFIANYDEILSLPPYPQLSFNIDSFLGWLHNYLLSFGANSISGNIGAINAGTSLQSIGVNNLISATNSMATIAAHSTSPMITRGSSSSSTFSAVGATDFLIANKHITIASMKSIDNYFSVYGYKVNKIDIPNISSRPSWNYVKTSNAVITGNIPFQYLQTMIEKFNSGITFWHDDDIGNYSLPNSI